MVIIIWKDGTWCYEAELQAALNHGQSNHYEIHNVPNNFTEEECSDLADERKTQ